LSLAGKNMRSVKRKGGQRVKELKERGNMELEG
jgi:hypothetical protein